MGHSFTQPVHKDSDLPPNVADFVYPSTKYNGPSHIIVSSGSTKLPVNVLIDKIKGTLYGMKYLKIWEFLRLRPINLHSFA